MFNLNYLSNDDKRKLEKLQEKLTQASSPLARNEIELTIQEILARAKPYTQCDVFEADELKSQLLTKINILAGLGKTAETFRMHLRDVEFHIQTLQMQDILKEKDRLKPGEPPNQRHKMSEKKTKVQKEAFGSHRWQIGFEDEPNE